MRTFAILLASLLVVSMTGAAAQEEPEAPPVEQDETARTLQVTESLEYGPYVTDGDGRTLYLFMTVQEGGQEDTGPDRVTEGVRDAAASCNDECVQAWPTFQHAAEELEIGEGIDADLVYNATVDGREQHVVYNGWPLYYFGRDTAPGQVNGHEVEAFGGTWFLVSPGGHKLAPENGQ